MNEENVANGKFMLQMGKLQPWGWCQLRFILICFNNAAASLRLPVA